MSDTTPSEFMREVDEDLRREHYEQLWRRYGGWLLAAAIALVLGVAAFEGISAWRANQRAVEGGRFGEALRLLEAGQTDKAATTFADLGQSAGGGYGALAKLQEAALHAQKGEVSAALALYDGVATSASDAALRDLAFLAAASLRVDNADPDELIAKLASYTAAENPWHATARELTALCYLRKGDKANAGRLFTQIADDAGSPQGARARAAQMRELAN